ncbi:MAG TPA: enoyl-CoA hydratase/isomerase family protein [Stellaceae bacterium]|nr:enoyl-CoA hydratase/isomerase family protein [Stellaceae bacterium]
MSAAPAAAVSEAARVWADAAPAAGGDRSEDSARFGRFWREGQALLAPLPPKPRRGAGEAATASFILAAARAARERYLRRHARALYDELTAGRTRFLRLDELVQETARLVPGLAPARAELAAESALSQGEKDGHEIDHGLLVSAFLADPETGMHLCHAMLLPRAESPEHAREFAVAGKLDLGAALVERRGRAVHVTMANPRFLNAEDDTTLDALEIAADVATLDPASDIVILRGGEVQHPKWRGRRVFSAGINLTHLYRGKIPFLWFLKRDMGVVNKFCRGVALADTSPDELAGGTIEKPWVAAVDGFAIGGGCQILLAVDHVVAARDAYMTLPARKEGIIPGAANLRLARFTGERLARQAILMERRLDCDSPEGRLICDSVVAPQDMDAEIDRMVASFTQSGVVSAAGNRRALRVALEPFDLFRCYMAVYAREQAYCHFSPALIANLERNWNAAQRKE